MPVTCHMCGGQNSDVDRFCRTCGNVLSTTAPQQPPTTSPSPSYEQPSYASQFAQTNYPGGYQPVPPSPQMDYALWANRAIGFILDSLIVGGAMVVLYLIFMIVFGVVGGALNAVGAEDAGSAVGGIGCCLLFTLFPIATLLVGLYNKIYLVSKRGYSIGQGVMKLKVVDANGNLISTGTAAIRLLAAIGLGFVPIVGSALDLLWPLWDEKRQTLHDKAVNTFVINNR